MTTRPTRVLFATSNGTGLGHLNRAMAIGRRLPEGHEPVLFTLSQAAPVVARAGFRVEYHPAYRRPASGSDWQWNLRLRRRLEALLEAEGPDLVVFDGVHPYRALTHVLTAAGAPPSIWCRRPLWRAGSSAAPLRRTGAFDAVLEPGELAGSRDRGPTAARRAEAIGVDPIVYLDPDELLGRERAAAELGLDPERITALVNLGQGGATDDAVARVLARLRAEPELQVAALESSIGAGLTVPDGVVRLRATFPMSRYLRAFDLAVAAAGYNSFHELIAFAVPTLFVPMPRNTDDQAARAGWAADAGVGRAVRGPGDEAIAGELEVLLDPGERARLAAACQEAFPGNGAGAAAALVAAAARGEEPKPRVRRPGRLNRWLRYSSHPVGPSLPLALGLTARDLGRHPERRRPRALISAFGVAEGELEGRLVAAIAALGVPPGRILVVTDTLELATMRGLGLGFQRLPTASELGLGPDSHAYLERVEDRVEAILAPWRGSWPVAGIGPVPAALRTRAAGPIREPAVAGVRA
jgi:UDP:flavonoid glycosyltransferase YjiC (YdhE family)